MLLNMSLSLLSIMDVSVDLTLHHVVSSRSSLLNEPTGNPYMRGETVRLCLKNKTNNLKP